ncbi:MAG: hypothetical protein KDD44_03150 [Bdellovibrionales bacterium]|nr:hypothetical protein [Bdellovibrionales bacterium]
MSSRKDLPLREAETMTAEQLERLHSGGFVFLLTDYSVWRATGADAKRYLQGRITQDIASAASGENRGSLLLTPQGKILCKFRVLFDDDSYVFVVEPVPEDGTPFDEGLLRFKVADDVQLDRLPYRVLSLCGNRTEDALRAASLPALCEPRHFERVNVEGTPCYVVAPSSTGFPGVDLLIDDSHADRVINALLATDGIERGDAALFDALQVASHTPRYGRDLSEKIAAPEIASQELISFSKGCYAGQEVVEMAHARGRPNRQLVTLIGASTSSPASSLENSAVSLDAKGNERVGFVTAAAIIPRNGSDNTACLSFIKSKALDAEEFYIEGEPFRSVPQDTPLL